MSLFRNMRGSLYNNTTHLTAVSRFARNRHDVKIENRIPFIDAARTIHGAAKMYGTHNPGIKEQFFQSNLQMRTVGHDAMLQVRDSERENENNPLLRSVETKPVRFSKRDVNLVERESMEMDQDVKNVDTIRTLPIAEKSELNIGNTLPVNANADVREFKKPTNYSDLEFTLEKNNNNKNKTGRGKKRKQISSDLVPNQSAPPLGKKAKEIINPETLVKRVKANLHPRQST